MTNHRIDPQSPKPGPEVPIRTPRRRRLAVLALASLITTFPATRALAVWNPLELLGRLLGSNGGSVTPQQAYGAYVQAWTGAIIGGPTGVIPETLMGVLVTGTNEVSLDQRIKICHETGGRFTTRLDVSACTNGLARLVPAPGADGIPSQVQACNRGNGSGYSNVCTYRDKAGNLYWDDGPSIPNWADTALPGSANYKLLFWPAG